MAEVRCSICGKKTDSGYIGVKWCPECQIWLCSRCGGAGRKQCPKCKRQTLK